MNNKLPDIKLDFPQWYQEIVYASELADLSPVRGCIVIRPYGYAIWENIRDILDKKIKKTGHQNASFPLLIPESFLKREEKHIEGFAPEVAVVTIAGSKPLEEPLVIRPTSETIIHYMFSKWIKSWRDLPLKINHWANVVRWELRTRPFLRTTEFLWQEGHTAHATYQEAQEEANLMLNEYKDLIENYLAIPVVAAKKPDSERFAGADITLTVESLMQDGKALQMGTSHLLSQNFAKSFEIVFQDKEGKLAYPYLTSWGITTRLIGAIVMVHGDQKGLILPPKISPTQVVIVPIIKNKETSQAVIETANKISQNLKDLDIRVIVDDDNQASPGAKFYRWELKGVPLRIEIGARDIENNSAIIVDRLSSNKESVDLDNIINTIKARLEFIQREMFNKALEKRNRLWFKKAKLSEFVSDLENIGGFYQTGWCKREECENLVKQAKGTIRCVLEDKEFKKCFNCDLDSHNDILVAKSY